jgi:oligopeptide/dipeptide ABC transporter ATP-binding protein
MSNGFVVEEKRQKLLKVENLKLSFRTSKGEIKVIDGLDFEMNRNEAVVILGESGSGKTSFAKAVLRLLPRNVKEYSGRVLLNGQDLMPLSGEAFRKQVRWVKISMVPQAAMNSLNPVLRVGDQVAEPLVTHYGTSKSDALKQALEAFRHVGVPADFLNRYAFELSGGMRQRVAIAMAMVTNPDLIILDEPTSALDMLTQANIMNVLKRIKQETEMSFILITHDIATSSELADRVAVMYAGQMVELNDAQHFFTDPYHPYSKKLMASVPKLRQVEEPDFISGQPPSLFNPPVGCRFADRCPSYFSKCDQEPPIFDQAAGQRVKCWLYE